jgi:hypothetical protein
MPFNNLQRRQADMIRRHGRRHHVDIRVQTCLHRHRVVDILQGLFVVGQQVVEVAQLGETQHEELVLGEARVLEEGDHGFECLAGQIELAWARNQKENTLTKS